MPAPPDESLEDLAGDGYEVMLARLHAALQPRSYLEVGTNQGNSLVLSHCASIAIDPAFALASPAAVSNKPFCGLYQMTSDAFFAQVNPQAVLGRPIDLGFLDGMHQCEFLLRDFINAEAHCHPGSVLALHDCLPLEHAMAGRERGWQAVRPERAMWWTGDVWRTLRALRQFRPDLRFTVLDAPPSGLVLVDRLDSHSTLLRDRYAEVVAAMLAMSLEQIGIARHHAEMAVVSTATLDTPEKLLARFNRFG